MESAKRAMKRFKSISQVASTVALVGIVMLGTQGCDGFGDKFLEKPPTQDVTKDTVFGDPDLAQRFLTNAYRSLPYGPGRTSGPYDTNAFAGDILASLTDINQTFFEAGGVSKFYYPGIYNASTAQNQSHQVKFNYFNSGAWDGIRKGYTFLENVGQVPDMDESTKTRLKAEARMIIAAQYIRLFRNYGGMPWVNEAFRPSDDLNRPRMTARATLDSIVAVVDRAAPDLPWTRSSTQSGRFTRAGARGLKCRLLLFGASPLFNDSSPYMEGEAASQEMVWYGGYDPSLWQRAADACGNLIDEMPSSYHLLDTGNPRQDFQNAYYNRGSPEVLVSTRVRYRSPNSTVGYAYYYQDFIQRGAAATTHNYVQMFPMASGKPIDDPTSNYDPQNPYENRDPRLYETVLVNGDRYQSRTVELWIGGRERQSAGNQGTATGYRARKFILDVVSATGTVVHWPWLRLPEIYLSYAEALNEANGGPTSEAYEYVNRVRNRVGLADLPEGLSQEEFRNAVLRERALELGYEEVRWYDLVRWKRREDMTKTLYGMNICKRGETPASACNAEGYGSKELIYDRFELPERQWQNDWSPKWYLSAFPVDEVNKDYGLVQNPGW